MRLKTTLGLAPLAVAALLAGAPARAQDLTIATSLPSLGFPFFVHMQNQLNAEAEKLGGIEVVELRRRRTRPPKQTADVEAAIVSGVDGLDHQPARLRWPWRRR